MPPPTALSSSSVVPDTAVTGKKVKFSDVDYKEIDRQADQVDLRNTKGASNDGPGAVAGFAHSFFAHSIERPVGTDPRKPEEMGIMYYLRVVRAAEDALEGNRQDGTTTLTSSADSWQCQPAWSDVDSASKAYVRLCTSFHKSARDKGRTLSFDDHDAFSRHLTACKAEREHLAAASRDDFAAVRRWIHEKPGLQKIELNNSQQDDEGKHGSDSLAATTLVPCSVHEAAREALLAVKSLYEVAVINAPMVLEAFLASQQPAASGANGRIRRKRSFGGGRNNAPAPTTFSSSSGAMSLEASWSPIAAGARSFVSLDFGVLFAHVFMDRAAARAVVTALARLHSAMFAVSATGAVRVPIAAAVDVGAFTVVFLPVVPLADPNEPGAPKVKAPIGGVTHVTLAPDDDPSEPHCPMLRHVIETAAVLCRGVKYGEGRGNNEETERFAHCVNRAVSSLCCGLDLRWYFVDFLAAVDLALLRVSRDHREPTSRLVVRRERILPSSPPPPMPAKDLAMTVVLALVGADVDDARNMSLHESLTKAATTWKDAATASWSGTIRGGNPPMNAESLSWSIQQAAIHLCSSKEIQRSLHDNGINLRFLFAVYLRFCSIYQPPVAPSSTPLPHWFNVLRLGVATELAARTIKWIVRSEVSLVGHEGNQELFEESLNRLLFGCIMRGHRVWRQVLSLAFTKFARGGQVVEKDVTTLSGDVPSRFLGLFEDSVDARTTAAVAVGHTSKKSAYFYAAGPFFVHSIVSVLDEVFSKEIGIHFESASRRFVRRDRAEGDIVNNSFAAAQSTSTSESGSSTFGLLRGVACSPACVAFLAQQYRAGGGHIVRRRASDATHRRSSQDGKAASHDGAPQSVLQGSSDDDGTGRRRPPRQLLIGELPKTATAASSPSDVSMDWPHRMLRCAELLLEEEFGGQPSPWLLSNSEFLGRFMPGHESQAFHAMAALAESAMTSAVDGADSKARRRSGENAVKLANVAVAAAVHPGRVQGGAAIARMIIFMMRSAYGGYDGSSNHDRRWAMASEPAASTASSRYPPFLSCALLPPSDSLVWRQHLRNIGAAWRCPTSAAASLCSFWTDSGDAVVALPSSVTFAYRSSEEVSQDVAMVVRITAESLGGRTADPVSASPSSLFPVAVVRSVLSTLVITDLLPALRRGGGMEASGKSPGLSQRRALLISSYRAIFQGAIRCAASDNPLPRSILLALLSVSHDMIEVHADLFGRASAQTKAAFALQVAVATAAFEGRFVEEDHRRAAAELKSRMRLLGSMKVTEMDALASDVAFLELLAKAASALLACGEYQRSEFIMQWAMELCNAQIEENEMMKAVNRRREEMERACRLMQAWVRRRGKVHVPIAARNLEAQASIFAVGVALMEEGHRRGLQRLCLQREEEAMRRTLVRESSEPFLPLSDAALMKFTLLAMWKHDTLAIAEGFVPHWALVATAVMTVGAQGNVELEARRRELLKDKETYCRAALYKMHIAGRVAVRHGLACDRHEDNLELGRIASIAFQTEDMPDTGAATRSPTTTGEEVVLRRQDSRALGGGKGRGRSDAPRDLSSLVRMGLVDDEKASGAQGRRNADVRKELPQKTGVSTQSTATGPCDDQDGPTVMMTTDDRPPTPKRTTVLRPLMLPRVATLAPRAAARLQVSTPPGGKAESRTPPPLDPHRLGRYNGRPLKEELPAPHRVSQKFVSDKDKALAELRRLQASAVRNESERIRLVLLREKGGGSGDMRHSPLAITRAESTNYEERRRSTSPSEPTKKRSMSPPPAQEDNDAEDIVKIRRLRSLQLQDQKTDAELKRLLALAAVVQRKQRF